MTVIPTKFDLVAEIFGKEMDNEIVAHFRLTPEFHEWVRASLKKPEKFIWRTRPPYVHAWLETDCEDDALMLKLRWGGDV